MLTEQEKLTMCQAMDVDLTMAFPDTRVEKLIAFVSKLQVRMLSDVGQELRRTAFIMGNDMWRERNQVNDCASYFEQQAAEIVVNLL